MLESISMHHPNHRHHHHLNIIELPRDEAQVDVSKNFQRVSNSIRSSVRSSDQCEYCPYSRKSKNQGMAVVRIAQLTKDFLNTTNDNLQNQMRELPNNVSKLKDKIKDEINDLPSKIKKKVSSVFSSCDKDLINDESESEQVMKFDESNDNFIRELNDSNFMQNFDWDNAVIQIPLKIKSQNKLSPLARNKDDYAMNEICNHDKHEIPNTQEAKLLQSNKKESLPFNKNLTLSKIDSDQKKIIGSSNNMSVVNSKYYDSVDSELLEEKNSSSKYDLNKKNSSIKYEGCCSKLRSNKDRERKSLIKKNLIDVTGNKDIKSRSQIDRQKLDNRVNHRKISNSEEHSDQDIYSSSSFNSKRVAKDHLKNRSVADKADIKSRSSSSIIHPKLPERCKFAKYARRHQSDYKLDNDSSYRSNNEFPHDYSIPSYHGDYSRDRDLEKRHKLSDHSGSCRKNNLENYWAHDSRYKLRENNYKIESPSIDRSELKTKSTRKQTDKSDISCSSCDESDRNSKYPVMTLYPIGDRHKIIFSTNKKFTPNINKNKYWTRINPDETSYIINQVPKHEMHDNLHATIFRDLPKK